MSRHAIPRFTLAFGLLVLCLSSLWSCEMLDDHDDDDSPKAPKATVTSGDAEVLATLVAIDDHEIAAAKKAQDKAKDTAVRSYADMLRTDHERNLEDTRALADRIGVDPHRTAKVIEMRKKNDNERETLADRNGAAYDEAFVKAMVTGHQEVLDLIDDQLLAKAQTPALKDHLKATRKHIQHHLERAKEIRDDLDGMEGTHDADDTHDVK